MTKQVDEQFSEEETARRRDAALLRALSTPHKRQAELKVGRKPKPESGGEASPKKRGRPSKSAG
jgi:hypothetical protein